MRALPALVGLCAGLAAAQGCTVLATPTYTATATIVVNASGPDGPDPLPAQNLTPTVTRLVGSAEIAGAAAAALRLPVTSLTGRITGTSEPGSTLVTVTATAPSATAAADLANAATEAVHGRVPRLGIQPALELRTLERAAPPRVPTWPNPPLNWAVGGLAGLLAGLGLARLRNRTAGPLTGPAQIQSTLHLPVLGVIPQLSRRSAGQVTEACRTRRDVAEAVTMTATAVAVAVAGLPRRRLLVTSAHDQDGKALAAALLALGLADQHHRVTLVEAQPREPALTEHFPSAARGCTLRQALAGSHVPQPLDAEPNLTVLPELMVLPDQTEPTGQSEHAFAALLDRLTAEGELVLLHAPPVLAAGDFAALAALADGVLLVVGEGVTQAGHARRAADLLRRLALPLTAVVVTGRGPTTGWPVVTAAEAHPSGVEAHPSGVEAHPSGPAGSAGLRPVPLAARQVTAGTIYRSRAATSRPPAPTIRRPRNADAQPPAGEEATRPDTGGQRPDEPAEPDTLLAVMRAAGDATPLRTVSTDGRHPT